MFRVAVFNDIALVLAGILALIGFLHVIGVAPLREAFRRWEYPRNFHRIFGVANLVAAAFLAVPNTRVWGVGLAAVILFAAVAKLLASRNYLYAAGGVVLLAALPPAFVAATL